MKKACISLGDFIHNRETVNAGYEFYFFMLIKGSVKKNDKGKLWEGVFFLHDKVPAHSAGKMTEGLKNLGF